MTDIKNNELKNIKDQYTKSIDKLVQDYNINMGDYISKEINNHDVMIEDYYNEVDRTLDNLCAFLWDIRDKFYGTQYNRTLELIQNVRNEVANIDSVFSEYKDYIKDSVEWTSESVDNIVNDTDTLQEFNEDINNLLELKDRKDTLEYEINHFSSLK